MTEKSGAMQVDLKLVRQLAELLDETSLSEIEVEDGGRKIRVARTITGAVMAAPSPVQPAPVAAPASAAPALPAGDHPGTVKSPMVGTAYLSPEPGAPPFIKVGDSVTAGQTIMVVEAMKTFNPIPAPRAGKVAAILVEDAQPVEFGEPLVILQ